MPHGYLALAGNLRFISLLGTSILLLHTVWKLLLFWVSRSTLGLRTAMQQQYHLTFTMPLAPTPKKKQQEDDPQLPDDLAVLQTVGNRSHP